MKPLTTVEISLDEVRQGLRLWIDARRPDSLFDAEETAKEHNEARFQLLEGCFYDYKISDSDFVLGDVGENIIQQHKRATNLGTIAPGIFVGTLSVPLLEFATGNECCTIEFEVQSVKSGYRDDYRDMLELITERCTELLLKAGSPVSHHLEIDYLSYAQTLYQRFAFIRSVVGTDEFSEAVHRIISAPVTRWSETTEEKDILSARRFSKTNINEILKSSSRTPLPPQHYLRNYCIDSLPSKISAFRKTDSIDAPENRFIKHALETFLKFGTVINVRAKKAGHKRLENESALMIRELENSLHHSVFKKISRPTTLKLNSPVLQRKEGYREIYRVWLMFDLAARLIWKGGDDIYSGGKKDIATLYEYWVYFKLLELFQSVFKIDSADIANLIEETPDGLNLRIKQGEFTALKGTYNSGGRKLNIRFNYNRTFTGKKNYPESGSWTTTLRPDYTLSIWPTGISEKEAESQELIVHLHFDAKYKIANLAELLDQRSDIEINAEKSDSRKGIYKNADLLKMHAYKDAIRRTGGAYILYPGDTTINQKGFHEIIPGVGAFPLKPSKFDSGIGDLKEFVLGVVNHFINRTSQREKLAYRTFDIFKNPPVPENIINEPLPEAFNENRDLIPDESYVLVGYYKSPEHFNWICKTGLYNFRTGSGSGSLILDKETVGARYLLIHTKGDSVSGNLWKIMSKGPKIYSKDDLVKKGYPSPSQDYYLVVEIQRISDPEFENVEWDFKKLQNYSTGRASAFPFTATLSELMKCKVK